MTRREHTERTKGWDRLPCTQCSPQPWGTPAHSTGTGRELTQDCQVGRQESGWGGTIANSQHHQLDLSYAGTRGHKPRPLCGGSRCDGFSALCTEGLSPACLGRGEGRVWGERNRASSTDSILQGEQPHRQGKESTRSRVGRGEDEREGLLAITAAVPSGWRSLPQPRLSVRTQTGPWSAPCQAAGLGCAPA